MFSLFILLFFYGQLVSSSVGAKVAHLFASERARIDLSHLNVNVRKRVFHGTEKINQAPATIRVKRAEELSNESLMVTAGKGQVYAAAGMRRQAEEVLANLEALPPERHVVPYHVALIHHFLGDKKKALRALEGCV